ncbi:MAG TPA: hypothetical protein VGE83_06155 [Terracidiphilus sp.]|jgi:hypothetical protein
MRFPVRFSASFAAVAALALCAGTRAQAQSTAAQTAGNGTYVVVDPLANVRYDNRFDVSLGMAYDHMKAGPTILQGSNLGGLDLTGSLWFARHWAVEGTGRGYVGTSGAGVNSVGIRGPFVAQYLFVGGPEWLGPHNKHGALIAHALVGGVYGNFQKDLLGYSPALFDFYNNQLAPAAIIGGHMDLNRSSRWVFRITPDAVMTHYSTDYPPKVSQFDVNFAISVGVEYKFKRKR